MAVSLGSVSAAHAGEDYGKGSVIFARGQSLFRVDAQGKGETEVAQFVTKAPVRALKTDAAGKTLLVDIGGTWGTMPLDGSTKTIYSIACGDGPAMLAEDGDAVVCRAPKGSSAPTTVIDLVAKTAKFLDVPIAGTRVVGDATARTIVWADKTSVWKAPVGDLTKKTVAGPEAPLRSFLVSPDGARAVGVWADQVYADLRKKKPAEILMGIQLDGIAARRRAIKNATPVEWSHDTKWILVQDGAAACLMGSTGGEYKCWKGYTAMSTAVDGRWTLVLGARDPKQKAAAPVMAKPTEEEGDDDAPISDVVVTPPSGPLALYRARLEGAFTETPVMVVRVVDGAAVWVPAKP